MTKYKVGDAVMIKELNKFKKCAGINFEGKMDHWAGKIMTIRKATPGLYKMNEDVKEKRNGWSWSDEMIECLVNSSIKNLNQGELMDFLEG